MDFAVSHTVENRKVFLQIPCVHQRERIKKPLTTNFQTDLSTPRAKTINKSRVMCTKRAFSRTFLCVFTMLSYVNESPRSWGGYFRKRSKKENEAKIDMTQKRNRSVLSCMGTSLVRSFDFGKGILRNFTPNEYISAPSVGKQSKIQETHAFSALFACLRDCAHLKNRPDFGTTRRYDIEPRLVGKLVQSAFSCCYSRE